LNNKSKIQELIVEKKIQREQQEIQT